MKIAMGDILIEFERFYSELYKTTLQATDQEIDQYLLGMEFPQIVEEQREFTDAPITLEELRKMVETLGADTAPGTDGFPFSLYKKHGEILIPIFQEVLDKAFERGTLTDSMREASITTDAKILAKLLANRLQKIVGSIIHHNQNGFVPGRRTVIV